MMGLALGVGLANPQIFLRGDKTGDYQSYCNVFIHCFYNYFQNKNARETLQ